MTDHLAMLMAPLAALSGSRARSSHASAYATVLICATPYDGMCVALAGASKRAGRDAEVITTDARHEPGRSIATISFVEERRSVDQIAGHPAWIAADGGTGRGETLTTFVLDMPFSREMLDGYADALVQGTAFPD